MDKEKILLVDDEKEILQQMQWAFADKYEVLTAESAAEAIEKTRIERPRLVTLDLGLVLHSSTEKEGLEVLKEIVALDRNLKVVVVTANTEREVAVRAIRLGAYDYYCKPVNLEELGFIMERALRIRRLEEENESLQGRLEEKYTFSNIIGGCQEMEEVFSLIRRVSCTDATVLIQGESGTGKELVAKAIHYDSERSKGPFITVNCGAIPENLIESELFGHEKGSFTGAHIQRRGKFELADGGTLFLDEIGEIPLALQVKLLRFIEDRSIERVGGRAPISLDLRILAATNRNLKKMLQEGTFRDDLYYRISVINITLPPLRDRGDDIILLARSFLERFAGELRKKVNDLSRSVEMAIRSYSWPGNVRELENKIKRGVIITRNQELRAKDIGIESDEKSGHHFHSLKEARRDLDIRMIRKALKRTTGNISRAAKELGISRVTLHDLINKYSLKR